MAVIFTIVRFDCKLASLVTAYKPAIHVPTRLVSHMEAYWQYPLSTAEFIYSFFFFFSFVPQFDDE